MKGLFVGLSFFFLLISMIRADPDINVDGYCSNLKTVTLLDFPLYTTVYYDGYFNGGSVSDNVFITSGNQSITLLYDNVTYWFHNSFGNETYINISLPDCGANYGPLVIGGSYCDEYRIVSFTMTINTSSTYYVVAYNNTDYQNSYPIFYGFQKLYLSIDSGETVYVGLFPNSYSNIAPPVALATYTGPSCPVVYGPVSVQTTPSEYCSNGRQLSFSSSFPGVASTTYVYFAYDAPSNLPVQNVTSGPYYSYFDVYNNYSNYATMLPPVSGASVLSIFTTSSVSPYYGVTSRYDWPLPDCGDNYGGINVDTSKFCNTSAFFVTPPSSGYLLTYMGPNLTNENYTSQYYTFGPYQFQINIAFPTPAFVEFRFWSSSVQFQSLPSARAVVSTSGINCPVFPFAVNATGYCNNFKKVSFYLDGYKSVYIYKDGPNNTSVNNIYNYGFNPMWLSAYIFEPGNYSATYSDTLTQTNVTFSVPNCGGNFGSWVVDTSTFCGSSHVITVKNPSIANDTNYDDRQVVIQSNGGNYYYYSSYFSGNYPLEFQVLPGDYVLTTSTSGYINGSYTRIETSHIEFTVEDCGKQYGNLTIDVSNWCLNGKKINITVQPQTAVVLVISADGNFRSGYSFEPGTVVEYYYNFDYNSSVPKTYQVSLPLAGYYSALKYSGSFGGSYPDARFDFILPQCGPTSNTPISIDSSNYCSDYKRIYITIPPYSVFFAFNYSASNPTNDQLLSVIYNNNQSQVTIPTNAPPGKYSVLSYVGNIPSTNNSDVLSKTDVEFPDCGDVFGPTPTVTVPDNFCNNYKRIYIDIPGAVNTTFILYKANQTNNSNSIGNLYGSGYVSVPGAGTYWIISGSVGNPTSSYYFTVNVNCPKEFGNITLDGVGSCNSHLQLRILVPPSITYYFFYDLDNNTYPNYYALTSVANYGPVPAYKSFSLPLTSTPTEFSVVSYSNYYQYQDPSIFVTSRKDFNASVPVCGNLFGPEYIIPTCDFANSLVTIGGVFQNTQYILYSVNDVTDSLYNATVAGYFYVFQETILKVNLPQGNLFILASQDHNVITSKLAIYAAAVSNSSASFNFPSTVKQGDIKYASVSLTGVDLDCFSSVTYCRFGSLVIEATNTNDDLLQCQIPSLPIGVYSVSFSIDGGFSFSTSCQTLQIVADANLTSFDYRETESSTNALFLWDSMSTASMSFVKIEIFSFSLVTVVGNSQILLQQKVGTVYNASANLGQIGWNPQNFDLSLIAIQISFGTSNSNFLRRAVAYINCKWSYCGRQSFCNKYGNTIQPAGTVTQALNPFDQACRSHAVCSNTSLCSSFCDEILIGQFSQILFHNPQSNPFNLNAPLSSAVSTDDIAWASLAVIAFSKIVLISIRVPPTTLPNPCPAVPTGTAVSTLACGDPHFTFGNIYFDMQLPGEFLYFRGYLQRSENGIYVGSNNFSVADAPTTIMTQQKDIINSPYYISVLTAVSIFPRQSPYSSIIISTKNGIELYHDGIKINFVRGCPYYFVGGSITFNSEYDISVILDDGIQLSLSAGYGSIWCMTMTITGIFFNTEGIYGSTIKNSDPSFPQAYCSNNTLYNLTTYSSFFGDFQNIGYGYCWILDQYENIFRKYNITIDSGNFARDISQNELPERQSSYPECEGLPNALLVAMCNYDIQYYQQVGIEPEIVASFSAPIGKAYNLATGVNIEPILSYDAGTIELTITFTLQNWNISENPLGVSIQKRSALSSNLQTITAWVDAAQQNYNGATIQMTLFPSVANCTTYFARVQVLTLTGNFSASPWIFTALASLGSCTPTSSDAGLPSLTTQPYWTTGSTTAGSTGSSTGGSTSATSATSSPVNNNSPVCVPSIFLAVLLLISLFL